MGVTLRNQLEISVNDATAGIELGRRLIEPDAESGGVIDLPTTGSCIVDLDADIGLRRNHPSGIFGVFENTHPGYPSQEIAAGVVLVPRDLRRVGDEPQPHPRLVSRPIVLVAGAPGTWRSQTFLRVEQQACAIVEGHGVMDRPPVARDELGLLEIEFLLVAERKNDGAVVIVALRGEMNGLRQREHKIRRTRALPFVRVVEHEWRRRVGWISSRAAFVHPTAEKFDLLRLQCQVVLERNPPGHRPGRHEPISCVGLDVGRPLHRMVERHERERRHISRMVAPLTVLLEERLDVAIELNSAMFDNHPASGLQRAADWGGLLDGNGLAGHHGSDRIGEIGGVSLWLPHEPARIAVVDQAGVSQHPVSIEHKHLRCGCCPKVGSGSFIWIEKHSAGDLRLSGESIDLVNIRRVADHRDECHALRAKAVHEVVEHRHTLIRDRAVEVEKSHNRCPAAFSRRQRPLFARRVTEPNWRHNPSGSTP